MKVIAKKNDYSGVVRKDREYIILGVHVPKKRKEWQYLVSYDGDRPYWRVSEYFDIVDNDILPDWHIAIYDDNHPLCDLFYLSGFDELCNNDDYFDALTERREWALDIYAKKYKEAVEWYEVKPFMTKNISLW